MTDKLPMKFFIGVVIMAGSICFGIGAVIGWNVHP